MTLTVKLPDGSQRQYQKRTRSLDIAQEIGPGLAKAAIAAEIDGQQVDLSTLLPADGEVSLRILTKKDPQALAIMRHSCAHVMARAVMRLFDGVQLAFGPTTENGFYYDMRLPRPLSEEDFPAIEAEMEKIVKANLEFERIEEPRDKALDALPRPGPRRSRSSTSAKGWPTMRRCRSIGRASSSTSAAARTCPAPARSARSSCSSVAGAYWKGDQSREQLQRLYGTAFFSKEELEQHLQAVEEAKRRDHRVLGKQLELFTTSPLVGRA